MTANEAREWLAAAGERQNSNRFLIQPPMALERLQQVQVRNLPSIITEWLTETGKEGSRADLQRVWDASFNVYYRNLRNDLRALFDALVAQAQRREVEMTKLVLIEEEKAAAARSAAANRHREKAAIEQAQKDLDLRRAKFEGDRP